MNCFKKQTKLRRHKTTALFLLAALLLPAQSWAETLIKFATLAPEGTSWTKILRQYAKEVEEKTAGRVKFKIYAGGVSGDEKDVVRKIRIGQLNAAGFTGFGIGEIAPDMRVLDAPFLFRNTTEMDLVYKKFDAEFRKIFEDKGFILLGWSEVGEVYIFSNSPVNMLEDASKFKMWLWEGDPIPQATFEAMGIKAIPLSIADVMTSLQTGMINAVYGTPATIIPLQWYSKMKYAIDQPITNASGAVLLSRKTFDSLSDVDKKTLMLLSEKHFRNLNEISRKDNLKSIETLKKKNIVFTRLPPQEKKKLMEAGKMAREKLAGSVYSRELLHRIEKETEALRKSENAKTTQ